MKIILIILLALIAPQIKGQELKEPKNLAQAMRILEGECTDSLKSVVANTPDNELEKMIYPRGKNFRKVFEWTKKDSDTKISKYLARRGVAAHQNIVILIALKNRLLHKTVKEKELLKPFQKIEKRWQEEDRVRYTTDSLRGIYIPKDLQDCFIQIDSFWDDSTRLLVRSRKEDEFAGRLHLSFGMWMRNNWQLWLDQD